MDIHDLKKNLPFYIFILVMALTPIKVHSQASLDTVIHLGNGDAEKGIDHVVSLANGGNGTASLLLAMIMAEVDEIDKALKYLKISANQGNRDAMKALADFELGGENYPVAIQWLKQSATLGNVNACMRLAIMSRDGIGTPQNNETAYFWFNVAGKLKKTSKAGDIEPEEFASEIAQHLSPKQINKLNQDADEWIMQNPDTPPVSIPPL